ncbi:MAG TPA: flavodoxin [Treponema sp.]|jgi:flavodoxin short chain|nr:flavodoxin [Treponema sp.]
MKKSIVYASTTGNTEAMANAVKEGAESSGAEVYFSTADSADAATVLASDVIILGSPAMGDEVLEDSVEEFFTSIEGSLQGKKVAIFGSYDWGDGQWLRDWAQRITSAGGSVLNGEGLKGHLEPDADTLEECKKLGAVQ